MIHDALEQRKDLKRRRRREALKIQITRVLGLAARHGCFQHSHMARTEQGEIAPTIMEFIENIKLVLYIQYIYINKPLSHPTQFISGY